MQQKREQIINENEILIQVEKICDSSYFKSKQVLCRFLNYIVSEQLAGRGESIKGYSIGVDAFNMREDFDPGQDALVRIHAGRLRRYLDQYYQKEGKYDKIRIRMPTGGYTPSFSYQPVSSEDNLTESDKRESQSFEPSIAIFPFKNLTGDPEKEYFTMGFSEELSIELTRYEDLSVFNVTYNKSVLTDNSLNFEFLQGKGIRFVIEGAVRQGDDQFRILVKLTDVYDGRQLWAERYNNELTAINLIEVQERIAKEISAIIGCEYGIIFQKLSFDSQRVKPQTVDTYIASMKFYSFQIHQTSETALQAFIALNQAIEKEPESGIATAMLSIMYGNRYMLDIPGAGESFDKMGVLAEKATKLDPNSMIVKVALAFKHFVYNERESFFQVVENCLAMKPGNSARLGALAFHMSLYGNWEKGKEILDNLMNSRIGFPLYFYGSTTLYYYRDKKYDKALEEANKYDVPFIFWGPMLRAAVLGQLNRPGDARDQIIHLKKLKPDFEEKARYLISRYVKEDELADDLLDGLQKAGLNL